MTNRSKFNSFSLVDDIFFCKPKTCKLWMRKKWNDPFLWVDGWWFDLFVFPYYTRFYCHGYTHIFVAIQFQWFKFDLFWFLLRLEIFHGWIPAVKCFVAFNHHFIILDIALTLGLWSSSFWFSPLPHNHHNIHNIHTDGNFAKQHV